MSVNWERTDDRDELEWESACRWCYRLSALGAAWWIGWAHGWWLTGLVLAAVTR